MRRLRLERARGALLAILWVTIAVPVGASACTNDAECDDGVACSIADTCQAGVCVAGGGGDSDGDGTCDADDGSDRPLSFTKARLRPILTFSNVLAKVEGFFPVGNADPFDPSAGFAVTITDGLTYTTTQVFAPGACPAGVGTIHCKTAGPGKISRATFKGLGPANPVVVFKFRLTEQAFGGPFAEPLTIDVRQTGTPIDRTGSIVDCKLVTSGIRCRQF